MTLVRFWPAMRGDDKVERCRRWMASDGAGFSKLAGVCMVWFEIVVEVGVGRYLEGL